MLDAYLPICLGRPLGKYTALPSFLSFQLFSASPSMTRPGCYLPTKRKPNKTAISTRPFSSHHDGDGGGGGGICLGALDTGLGCALPVFGCKSSLPTSCLPSYPLVSAQLAPEFKWGVLAAVPALHSGRAAAGVQQASPGTGTRQTWQVPIPALPSPSCGQGLVPGLL